MVKLQTPRWLLQWLLHGGLGVDVRNGAGCLGAAERVAGPVADGGRAILFLSSSQSLFCFDEAQGSYIACYGGCSVTRSYDTDGEYHVPCWSGLASLIGPCPLHPLKGCCCEVSRPPSLLC